MKTFITIATMLIFLMNVQATNDKRSGKTSESIPKKATTIVQTTEFTSRLEACRHIINILLQDGIIPEKVDTTNSFYIVTQPIQVKTSHVKLTFISTQEDNIIKVTTSGSVNANMEITLYGITSTSTWDKITFKGMKGSLYMNAWEYMYNTTQRIPAKSTEYQIK